MKLLLKCLAGLGLLLLAGGLGGYLYVQRKYQPAPNQLTLSGLPLRCTFAWQAGSTAQAALLLPIRLPGCPRRCYVQFDTGAPSSVFYAPPLAALAARYAGVRRALRLRADTLRDLRFGLGTGQVQARWMHTLAYGAHELPADTAAPLLVGTLGNDMLDGRVLVLDYRHHCFSVLAQLPDSLAGRTAFVPLAFEGRRLVLSAAVAGQPRQLLFDSGSSAFALLTSPATWQRLGSPTALARTDTVNSFGRPLIAHTVATAATMQIGQASVPLQTVTYIENVTLLQQLLMRFSGMGGMLGNRPFSQHTIVVDVAHRRFGLLP